MNHYNTTNESGQTLIDFESKAKTQDDEVLKFIKSKSIASPSFVWRSLYKERTPLTSVRRAMSNLTKKGLLIKTDIKQIGPYGRPEYCWKFYKSQKE